MPFADGQRTEAFRPCEPGWVAAERSPAHQCEAPAATSVATSSPSDASISSAPKCWIGRYATPRTHTPVAPVVAPIEGVS
jgi:hypothetical protein